MSTPAVVKGIASNLSSKDDAELEMYLDLAKAWVSESVWGSRYSAGLAYMAAHLATVASRGDKGNLTSESVGSVSKSYASHGTDDLATTSYGATFLSLRKTLVLTPFISRGY